MPHSCGLDHKKMSDALALIAKSGAKLPEKNSKSAVSDCSWLPQLARMCILIRNRNSNLMEQFLSSLSARVMCGNWKDFGDNKYIYSGTCGCLIQH